MVKVTYNKQLTALLVIDPYITISFPREARYGTGFMPSVTAVTTNALTVGPENVPIPINRKRNGLWNGRSPLPSRESTKSAHTSHVPA